jgi:hypothetical protein
MLASVASVLVAAPRYSAWSAPVNLGPVVNSASFDFGPCLSDDGRSLYLASRRPGGLGGSDIYVSQRASVHAPWGPPQNLGPNINTASDDQGPTLSPDGRRLYFFSTRPGGFGSSDLYVARRRHKRDDFEWQAAENLGPSINTTASEAGASLFEDEDTTILYFQSDRPGGRGGVDIYASTRDKDEDDGPFGAPALVEELSSASNDRVPAIGRDGLEMFLDSDRPGTLGGFDLWASTRRSTADHWSTPVNLGPSVNTAGFEGRPFPSFDARALFFFSDRPGGFGAIDLYVSTRTKLRQEREGDGDGEGDDHEDDGDEEK